MVQCRAQVGVTSFVEELGVVVGAGLERHASGPGCLAFRIEGEGGQILFEAQACLGKRARGDETPVQFRSAQRGHFAIGGMLRWKIRVGGREGIEAATSRCRVWHRP